MNGTINETTIATVLQELNYFATHRKNIPHVTHEET